MEEMTSDGTEHNDGLVRADFDSGILVLTIDHPPDNTLPGRFFAEFYERFQQAQAPAVRAVVITGQGRCFSKGADLREIRQDVSLLNEDRLAQANRVFDAMAALPKPVVAAIHGACFGGGLELALACHLRVCSEKAMLGLPEVSIGLVPGLGGIERLVAAIGPAKALEMILLGDMIPAAKALELYLVSRVFPRQDFLRSALGFVRVLLAAPPAAVAEVLELFHALDRGRGEGIRAASTAAFCRLAQRMKAGA